VIAEMHLNDIKGVEATFARAWSTAASWRRCRSELMKIGPAVRPTSSAGVLAKQAANIDHISQGRLTTAWVCVWWADEARKIWRGVEQHDDPLRRAPANGWTSDGVWRQDHFSTPVSYTAWKTTF